MTQDEEHLRLLSIFHFVVAGLSCLMMPFGTVLGVFTVIVLMRDSVKEMFGRQVQSVGTAR